MTFEPWRGLRGLTRDDGPESESKPFLEHLEDLRDTLVKSFVALVIGMIVAIPLTKPVFKLLMAPVDKIVAAGKTSPILGTLEVTGGFNLAMLVALWTGLLISLPFILWFLGQFIFPGLHDHERRIVRRSIGFAGGLFAFGVYIGYRFCLPAAFTAMIWFNDWMGIPAQWRINSYLSFTLQLLAAFGLVFELPIVLLILGKLGIIKSDLLRSKRRHAIVILLAIAMILTPADVVSMLIMGVPLVVLYEICIWMIVVEERRRAARDRKAGKA